MFEFVDKVNGDKLCDVLFCVFVLYMCMSEFVSGDVILVFGVIYCYILFSGCVFVYVGLCLVLL